MFARWLVQKLEMERHCVLSAITYHLHASPSSNGSLSSQPGVHLFESPGTGIYRRYRR